MATEVTVSKISRVDLRYRHSAQDVLPNRDPVQETDQDVESPDHIEEPLLIREQKGRAVMGRAHRMFHRRAAAEPSKVLTIVVNVDATIDPSGNVIALATSTPGLPSAQAVPSVIVLPSVPSVPPFPSDLTVPAYPWPSGVPTAQTSTSILSPSSTAPTITPITSSAAFSTIPSLSSLNSTISTSLLSSSFSSTSSVSLSTLLLSSESFSSTQSLEFSAITSDPPASTSPMGVGPGGAPANTAPAPAATTTTTNSASAETKDANPPLATPKVVGSVVGSLAGAALFLAIILLLLRRHKRRLQVGATRQITADDGADSQPMAASGQQMATRRSYVPASTAAFFNRFSGASRSTAETSTTGGGERGFQRISGRKLPSAFSEGMTSEQFAREGKLSGSSFYQDDKGFYGGPGIVGKEIGESSATGTVGIASAKERVVTMPSPARTPTIHHPPPPFGSSHNGGGSMLSPPHSPNPSIPSIAPRGTLGRSHPSQDGSRNSKFTEDV